MSKDEEEKEKSGFTFQDRRSSYLSDDASQEQEKQVQQEKAQEAKQQADREAAHSHGGPMEIDFSTFVLSLTSSAFYYLGDIPDPATGQVMENLPAVQQTIDILTMLKVKTQNNLSTEEAKLLEQLIYELQMKYIAKQKKK